MKECFRLYKFGNTIILMPTKAKPTTECSKAEPVTKTTTAEHTAAEPNAESIADPTNADYTALRKPSPEQSIVKPSL
jgi:hypothetical protein